MSNKKIRLLFLAANPKNTALIRLDEEIREIHSKVRAGEFRNNFDLVSRWAVRPGDLFQIFNEVQPHIVHFSAHGTHEAELVLEDDNGNPKLVSEEALKSLFRNQKENIRLVVLNSCHSESQAQAISQEIECAIGMNSGIGIHAAILFSSSFYGALAFGKSVSSSFEQGRISLMLEGIPEQNTPVLYSRVGIDVQTLRLIERKPFQDPRFESIKTQLPLIAEIKNDFDNKDAKFVREFIVVRSKKTVMNLSKQMFLYYDEEHSNLRGQVDVLENYGFVICLRTIDPPKYRMTEEFVQLLLEMH